ncbi:MAG: glycosyltransferase family 4 protein, partial [Nanoarchaeota archaeon]|nr:glycosyltransferase family 4 protein [Nanoarchaeota archaeon]
LEKELKELSKQLNVEKNVFFRGKIFSDALIKEYKSSHLFVLPSLYEGQPLTLLEAWAAKLPVVVTNVGGNKDFVVNEQNGYIIKVKDIDLLAATINKAIRNENLKKIGEEGYRIVNEKYDWDRITERIFLVYKNIIKSKN